MSLKNKVAIVTGCSSGIGKAIALRFAQEGVRVVASARRKELLEQTVAQIHDQGGKAVAVQTDISDEDQVDHMFAETETHFGTPDILINNAGVMGGDLVENLSTEEFDHTLNINLRGTFFCCRKGIQKMKTHGGLILNVSSVCGIDAWAGTAAYSASKYGIMGLTKALADEARKYNIKVSAICPGGVAASQVDAPEDEIQETGKISPFDIAETALYLARLGPNAIVHQIVVDRLGADW